MNDKKIKILVLYNEAHPEFYQKTTKPAPELDFKLYFEVETLTPMEEYEIMVKKLKRVGFDAHSLNIKDDLLVFLNEINNNPPDVIFNFVEIYKEKPRLEMNFVGLYELLGIPYTGAPAITLANCQSKFLTKKLLNYHGIKTAKFLLFKEIPEKINPEIKYPVIVKPAYEDASVGIENESIVTNTEALKRRIEYVFKHFDQAALVEEFIEGREFNVSVMGDQKLKALPISEIDFSKMPDHLHNIVSYQAKWDPHHESYHKTIPVCPAKISKSLEEKLKQTAISAFKIMGTRDYARVDMRVTNDEEIFVLEVNPNPDLTEGAGFMRSAHAAGMSYAQALKKIVMLAYERGKRAK
ncbi:MAG TPA: ATP-grasp domain-containing protein [Ignavibacteriaceae bacterium]|jgi:D-alanine-D-alanine ligase|nr:MAG: D-alanine--D-alanine ligase B [Ignavibacteria bacterium ADurb.Bin266]HQF41539.1 ATP-grasp domain-containing protein [Ignavibacteriaceae bacterium]HQI40257.1 ATP-grasp domain-containing protein [Ignavibacteriaceae bacterium]HQJ45956.1 ATP-grasp domain-containing protein [Ignavibacteriaceae bacterium]